jgi:hypothetical protein
MNQEIVPFEYYDAFRSVRCAKRLFWWLIAVALVVQLTSFVLVNFVGVIDGLYMSPSATAPAATEWARQATGDSAWQWRDVFYWVLPGSKFLAFSSAILLSLTLLLAVKLSLVGRLGGVAGLISAFFWSLILLAIVTPWQQVIRGTFACGALYNLDELLRAVAKVRGTWVTHDVSIFTWILFYARFIAFPVVAVLVWLVVASKFARGYRNMNLPRPAEILSAKP